MLIKCGNHIVNVVQTDATVRRGVNPYDRSFLHSAQLCRQVGRFWAVDFWRASCAAPFSWLEENSPFRVGGSRIAVAVAVAVTVAVAVSRSGWRQNLVLFKRSKLEYGDRKWDVDREEAGNDSVASVLREEILDGVVPRAGPFPAHGC